MSAGSSSKAPSSASSSSSRRARRAKDDWSGLSDSAERRRIQNRINQRAHRQRQKERDLEQSEDDQNVTRASSSVAQSPQPSLSSTSDAAISNSAPATSITMLPQPALQPATLPSIPPLLQAQPLTAQSAPEWDTLATTINTNVLEATLFNLHYLGLNKTHLDATIPMLTPRNHAEDTPAALIPITLQYEVPHDPFIDAIPHPRFRENVLQAMLKRTINTPLLSAALRRSGTILLIRGQRLRDGVVVWENNQGVRLWELSTLFVMMWHPWLEGCEDWIATTNICRQTRGESVLALPGQNV